MFHILLQKYSLCFITGLDRFEITLIFGSFCLPSLAFSVMSQQWKQTYLIISKSPSLKFFKVSPGEKDKILNSEKT